jgi:transcriptional regulator with XRE-family HTH domain
MLTPTKIGLLLHRSRLRRQLSQPEAARCAGVSTRLWSEVERGTRPNVSFTTLVRMCTRVDVVVDASATSALSPSRLSATQIAALRDDLRRAAEYGVDIARLREGLAVTPREHAERNDEALAFFRGVSVTRGWHPQRASPTKRRERARR